MIFASLCFYSYWDVINLPILLTSILVNYLVGHFLSKYRSKVVLTSGIAFNLLFLGYFKYTDFVLQNLNSLVGTAFELQSIVLPLGVSFFTFTQTAYLVDVYRVKNIPSCVTFYDGQLWVATHSIWTNATMIGYNYNEERNSLNSLVSFWIPPKVQGVAFTEEGEVYLSTSYGRKKSSYIKKYDSIYAMTNDVDDYIEQIELPPCSEGIACKDDKVYVLFESAGKKYLEGTDGKGKSLSPLDKILVFRK